MKLNGGLIVYWNNYKYEIFIQKSLSIVQRNSRIVIISMQFLKHVKGYLLE